jgi:hypothetical protein
LAKRSNPYPEAGFVHGDDLRHVDDACLWQVGIAFVEFNVARIIGAVRSRGGSANHNGIYGTCVENVTLNDYSRTHVARFGP